MTRSSIFALTQLVLIAASAPAAQPPDASERATGYELVWADEFDKTGRPDPNNWTYEQGFVRNRELQWYQPENARCKDGLLIIEARRERKPNPHYDPAADSWRRSRRHAEYTSACLITRGLHSWTYGRFEMRARIDTRAGMWPAFLPRAALHPAQPRHRRHQRRRSYENKIPRPLRNRPRPRLPAVAAEDTHTIGYPLAGGYSSSLTTVSCGFHRVSLFASISSRSAWSLSLHSWTRKSAKS